MRSPSKKNSKLNLDLEIVEYQPDLPEFKESPKPRIHARYLRAIK